MDLESARRTVAQSHVTVRPAAADDLDALNDLDNQYVLESHYTFDLQPITLHARREWFTHYGQTGRHRLMVAVSETQLIGYATSSRFRPKAAYETSIETSVYVAADTTGLGVGTKLYAALFSSLEGEDIHRACAGIALPNPASLALHERFGFKKVAHFTEQGRKFGKYWDVAWFEKAMSNV